MPPIQRRHGQPATVYPTKVHVDSRGNQVAIADLTAGFEIRAWVVPARSSRADVAGGQQDLNVVRLGTDAELPGVDSWSRIMWRGVMWDVVDPPAFHYGTRHVRHWSFDIRRRPSQHA